MTVAVLANDAQWSEAIALSASVDWLRILPGVTWQHADAGLLLEQFNNLNVAAFGKPLFVNAVVNTLDQLKLPASAVRINGWAGFLHRPLWEIAGPLSAAHEQVLAAWGKRCILVADEPGLVAARPVAMIINEAFFALGENISTPHDIDTAMKLGTNYPLGPFEWANKIGVTAVYNLLDTLSQKEARYTPAPLLKSAIES